MPIENAGSSKSVLHHVAAMHKLLFDAWYCRTPHREGVFMGIIHFGIGTVFMLASLGFPVGAMFDPMFEALPPSIWALIAYSIWACHWVSPVLADEKKAFFCNHMAFYFTEIYTAIFSFIIAASMGGLTGVTTYSAVFLLSISRRRFMAKEWTVRNDRYPN